MKNTGPVSTQTLVSFDGFDTAKVCIQEPDRYRYWDEQKAEQLQISRGAGLSYVGASFCAKSTSVSLRHFNRILDFCTHTNSVDVETGISLQELNAFLRSKNRYLPIQPGYGRITVGGCIAANTHGKNPCIDGTFIDIVSSLTLFHPAYGMIEASRDENEDVFDLTCGGYGTTGHIIRARLKVRDIQTQTVIVKSHYFSAPQKLIEAQKEMTPRSLFCYSWHSMLHSGKNFGQGIVFEGQFSEGSPVHNEPKGTLAAATLASHTRGMLPISLMNQMSLRCINAYFSYKSRRLQKGKESSLQEALFPIHGQELYFKLFGKKGFHEYQAIIPFQKTEEYFDVVKFLSKKFKIILTLGSGKIFSGQTQNLRYNGKGVSLALNLPRNPSSLQFMSALDAKIIAMSGVPNIIKDSRLPASTVEACYPDYHKVRQRLISFDPKRLFCSILTQRLEL